MSNNISMYSDSELADMFDNDEYLYNCAMAATDFIELAELADEMFIFTVDQLDEFANDFHNGRWS